MLTHEYGPVTNYELDRLGSVAAMTNTDGTLSNTYRYDPWGVGIGVTGSRYNPMRYTGSYVDFGTPYYQMGARYYQPQTGRFTQQDPLGSSVLEPNRYAYAGCNPSNYVDPTGLFRIGIDTVIGCALAAFDYLNGPLPGIPESAAEIIVDRAGFAFGSSFDAATTDWWGVGLGVGAFFGGVVALVYPPAAPAAATIGTVAITYSVVTCITDILRDNGITG